MRLLITGASGFVGRSVQELLHEIDGEVVLTARGTEAPPDLASHVSWIPMDLLEEGGAEALVERVRPSHLLHLAWQATPVHFWTSPENLTWAETSMRLVRAFSATGGHRIVGVGSAAEYAASARPCHESDTPLDPGTLYGASKAATWFAFSRATRALEIEVAWARLFQVYGPHEPAQRLVPSVASSLLQGRRVATTRGRQIRDFVHVSDVARALLTLVENKAEGAFNVATGSGTAVGEAIDLIGEVTGRPELIDKGALTEDEDESVLTANVAKLSDLGWSPSLDLHEGIAQTVDWWRSQVDAGA